MTEATAPSRESPINTLERDLACPNCDYNLRGLPGPVVACPECGCKCDIPKLITARWNKPWYRAPKFNIVLAPATVAFIGVVVFLI
ncbi:MAG: hypothetical protein MI741_08225, partial [Rhodospirillales bacterium]|nr:hypothetical protein [Rhodospirillales bacterium]